MDINHHSRFDYCVATFQTVLGYYGRWTNYVSASPRGVAQDGTCFVPIQASAVGGLLWYGGKKCLFRIPTPGPGPILVTDGKSLLVPAEQFNPGSWRDYTTGTCWATVCSLTPCCCTIRRKTGLRRRWGSWEAVDARWPCEEQTIWLACVGGVGGVACGCGCGAEEGG